MYYYYFYQVAMISSLIFSLFLIVLTWPYRNVYGAKAMLALLISIFVWTLGFLLEANSQTLDQQLFFNNIGYLGTMATPVAWFVFTLNYSNNLRIFDWRLAFFCIIPVIITALIWTNNYHHLMWSNEHLGTSGVFNITIKSYGPFFWVALINNYALIILGSVILLRRLFIGKRLYRAQAVAMISAILIPWIWNIVYVFNLTPLPRKDLTPVAFTVSCIALAIGLLRFQVFSIIPFAHEFVIKHLNDGIFAFNKHGNLVDVNPAGLEMLHLDDNIIGKRLEDITHISPVLENLHQIHLDDSKSPVTLRQGEYIYELQISPMLDEIKKQVGWLAIIRDISERKRNEEQAHEAETLKKIDQLRTDLLANVSHELRTPLASIKGFASTLLRTDTKWNETEQRDFLQTIDEEADRLNHIIGDILDISRIDSGALKLNIGIHNIQEMLVSARVRLAPLTIHHRLEINIPSNLPLVYADEMRIGQVLSNLVDNAVKYSPEGSEITIDVGVAIDEVVVSVIDRGFGIAPEALPQLFDRFYQVERVVRGQRKGTGLGLSICRGIIQAHGGKIWVESTIGKGSKFSFSLPVSWLD